MCKNRTMRRELSQYIIGISVLTAVMYTFLLSYYFDSGLTKAGRFTTMLEIRHFEQLYKQDSNAPLPQSSMRHFYFNKDWQQASELHKQLVPFSELKEGQFYEIEWHPEGKKKDWRESLFIIVYVHRLYDGNLLYVLEEYDVGLLTQDEYDSFEQMENRILYAAAVYLLLVLSVLWFYNRRIARYTTHLANWAEQLSLDNLDEATPDFRYQELTRISEQLKLAFERIASLLEKEHRFLRNASHELRTPIAVIKSNMELIKRLEVNDSLAKPLQRVAEANQGMQELTETLLWLGREDEAAPQVKQIVMAKLLDRLIDDLRYLLQGKHVKIQLEDKSSLSTVGLAETPLKIVVGNLLRNAFQYTQQGAIDIYIDNEQLIIENTDIHATEIDKDNSFGMGLTLVQQLCKRLNWQLELIRLDTGIKAVFTLPVNKAS